MKLIILILFLLLSKNLISQTNNELKMENQYDSSYAEKLGADDYGMKKYVMAFLKSGKAETKNESEAQQLQMEHMKNIQIMAEEGKLLIAGPFTDNGELRGIYIFNVETVEEAEELTSTDPAIKAGVLVMELHPWYGSAALMEVNSIHKKLQKKSFTDE